MFVNHTVASSDSISTSAPPFRSLLTDLILTLSAPKSPKILLSSVLSRNTSVWENFVLEIPSSRNCLALIPSLAAILGFACGGGVVRTEAYVLVGVCLTCAAELLMTWVSRSSVTLKWSSSFSLASTIYCLLEVYYAITTSLVVRLQLFLYIDKSWRNLKVAALGHWQVAEMSQILKLLQIFKFKLRATLYSASIFSDNKMAPIRVQFVQSQRYKFKHFFHFAKYQVLY